MTPWDNRLILSQYHSSVISIVMFHFVACLLLTQKQVFQLRHSAQFHSWLHDFIVIIIYF